MPNKSARENLLAWLREAHAIARHGETMMQGRAKDLDDYPQLKARIESHVIQTREQAERIQDCIERLGGSTSQIRDIGGKLSAIGHSLGTRMTREQAVQAHAASYAFEHFEIANYRALIVAADMAGETAIKSTCDDILGEQEAMADWLRDHLADTTRAFLGSLE